jgi:hypothetical protein
MQAQQIRQLVGVLLLGGVLAPGGAAAAVVNPNCALLNGPGNNISINLPNDDVVLTCQLKGRSVLIRAHSITIDGPAGGGIMTTGIAGIRLFAGKMNNGHDLCLDPDPFTATVTLKGATLDDGNINGDIKIVACGDVVVDTVGGSQLTSAGATLSLACLEPTVGPAGQPCRVKIDQAFLFGNRIQVTAEGDVSIACSTFQTRGPRDLHRIVSRQGSVLAGGLAVPPDPGTCDCPDPCGNRFRGENESNLVVEADDNIDLDHACVDISENITLLAHGTNGPLLANGVMIDLGFAEIRNDQPSPTLGPGKTGVITVTAHPIAPVGVADGGVKTGDGVIDVEQGLYVDQGKQAGGIDPTVVAAMNGGRQFLAGACAIDPATSCIGRGVNGVHNPTHADPASRALRSVINAAAVRCDS